MVLAFFIVCAVFLRVWSKEHEWTTLLPWLLLISAGGSNLLERLISGCVYDYLSVPLFPVFNLPDAILTLSVVFLIGKSWKHD